MKSITPDAHVYKIRWTKNKKSEVLKKCCLLNKKKTWIMNRAAI